MRIKTTGTGSRESDEPRRRGYGDRRRPVPGQDWNDMSADNRNIRDRPGSSEHPAQLRVGVVGAGRAGTGVAAALRRAGQEVVAASAVSEASVRRIRRDLPGTAIKQPAEVVSAADLVLLTVPDDVLPGLVAGLAATGADLAGRLGAHASGRHGLRVLDPAARARSLPRPLPPVMTFTRRPANIDRPARSSLGRTQPGA